MEVTVLYRLASGFRFEISCPGLQYMLTTNDYAVARFEAYFQHKARILAENSKRKAPNGIE